MILASRAKHPVKAHVWAGISYKGATRVVIFDGKERMDSEMFCQILLKEYIPFSASKFGPWPLNSGRLQMDNAPMHKSRFTTDFLQRHGITYNRWTARKVAGFEPNRECVACPEGVYPIRGEAAQSQRALGGNQTVLERKHDRKMTERQCRRYIDHVHRVIPAVLENDGTHSFSFLAVFIRCVVISCYFA